MSAVLRVGNWRPVSSAFWDDPNTAEWSKRHHLGDGKFSDLFLKISKKIFTSDGKLINISDQEWDKNIIRIEEVFESIEPEKTSNIVR
jgi:hypothetical protein